MGGRRRSSNRAGAGSGSESEAKVPPPDVAAAHPLGVDFEFQGRTFVRRKDGVHLVLKEPNHPAPSDRSAISQLALSFDGYDYGGSFGRCAEIAHTVGERFARTGRLTGTVEEIRTALFFEQRSYRHMGWPPTEEGMGYARALVAELRKELGDTWVEERMARRRGDGP